MIRIYGSSDDIVTVEGVDFNDGPAGVVAAGASDEVGAYDLAIRIAVGDSAGGVAITMTYAFYDRAGVWGALIEPWDEDVPIPWRVEVTNGGRGYSAEVVVAAPEGTPVRIERLAQ